MITDAWRGWTQFALVSAFFFFITGSTFTSFGVVLPFMIEELSWNWSEAGFGFSLLALMVGLFGAVPAWTIKKFGIAATFAIGGALMTVGFVFLALTADLDQYFIGTALLGIGYSLCAIVPGVHIISSWMPEKRSVAIGAYLTIGGLGGVAGPLIVTSIVAVADSWRMHWWVMAGTITVLMLLAIVLVRDKSGASGVVLRDAKPEEEKSSARVFKTEIEWRFREAVRTPQFYIIVSAFTMTMLVGLTVNSWAVTHMGTLGVSAVIAAGALSAHAAVNSFSRALGGMLSTRIDPKWLLVAALISEVLGSLALVVADNSIAIALFAFGEGFGFGMCLFATTVLMVNYFGKGEAPIILGTMHTVATLAMIGPMLGGFIADKLGSFAPVFQGYAVILLAMIVVAVLMRPPQYQKA